MKDRELLEHAYSTPQLIPWDEPAVPFELSDLIKNKEILPGRVLDIGCGLGHHSIWLAQQGFTVTGIDIAEKAIAYAKNRARLAKVTVEFIALDALKINTLLDEQFDLVFEWGILHFIPFVKRKSYIKSIAHLLPKGGKYISLSFNEKSPEWGGGKMRRGITGATIYYSSMLDLEKLFRPYFKIIEKKERLTTFKNSGNTHLHNYFLLERK